MPSLIRMFLCKSPPDDDGPGPKGEKQPDPDEITRLKKENARLKEENARLEGENIQLKKENARLKEENARLEGENTQLKNENIQLKNENIQLKNENTQLKKENADLQRRLADAKEQLKQALQDAQRHQAQAAQLAMTLEQERVANQKQNEERDVLLESLKAYLDTHDDVDASSLGMHLASVNDLVEQLASDLLFRWENPPRKAVIDPKGEVPQRLRGIIGAEVVQALIACNMNDNGSPSLLQYSFQAVLIARVSELFQARTFSSGEHTLVRTLSRKIREDEIQPVYGRWRSVTQRYLRATSPKHAETTALAHFAKHAAIDICDVARLFGYEVTEAPSYVQSEFEQSLSDIAKKTIKLANVVTADIITKDYELFSPKAGPFDSESMSTPFTLPKDQTDDKVFCTVSLGLFSIGKPGRQQVPLEERVFRPAQVLTKATLEEIMHPPPTRK